MHARAAAGGGRAHRRLLLQQRQRQRADDLHRRGPRLPGGRPLDRQRVRQPAAQLPLPRLVQLLHHLVVPHGRRRALDQRDGGRAALPAQRLHRQPRRRLHPGQGPGRPAGHLQRRRLRGEDDGRQRVGLRADHGRHPRPDVLREEQHGGGQRVQLGQHQAQHVRRRAAGQSVQVLLKTLRPAGPSQTQASVNSLLFWKECLRRI